MLSSLDHDKIASFVILTCASEEIQKKLYAVLQKVKSTVTAPARGKDGLSESHIRELDAITADDDDLIGDIKTFLAENTHEKTVALLKTLSLHVELSDTPATAEIKGDAAAASSSSSSSSGTTASDLSPISPELTALAYDILVLKTVTIDNLCAIIGQVGLGNKLNREALASVASSDPLTQQVNLITRLELELNKITAKNTAQTLLTIVSTFTHNRAETEAEAQAKKRQRQAEIKLSVEEQQRKETQAKEHIEKAKQDLVSLQEEMRRLQTQLAASEVAKARLEIHGEAAGEEAKRLEVSRREQMAILQAEVKQLQTQLAASTAIQGRQADTIKQLEAQREELVEETKRLKATRQKQETLALAEAERSADAQQSKGV
ncbi:hypothetical protein BH10PSE19_BH10PSE19_10380 [soil metagenome]